MKVLGEHLIVELYDCDFKMLSDVDKVQNIMLQAAKAAETTIIDSIFHHFTPHGVSGVVVIAESHFAIHTWPEHKYAAVDLFTCGTKTMPWKAFRVVKKLFKSKHFSVMKMERGIISK